MRLSRLAAALPLAAACLLPGWLSAQNPASVEEVLRGTWVLDLERSSFFEREPPRSQLMIFEPVPEGIRTTIVFTSRSGVENRVSYVAGEEGTAIPLRGSESFDTIIMESHGPYHATSTFTHAGRAVGHAERRISMDGREMTVVVERNGNLSSRAIFVKQEQ